MKKKILTKKGSLRKHSQLQIEPKEYKIPQIKSQVTGPEEVIYGGKVIMIPGPMIFE